MRRNRCSYALMDTCGIILIVMVGESDKSIGHIHRKLIGSVAWDQLDQLKTKPDAQNSCKISLHK